MSAVRQKLSNEIELDTKRKLEELSAFFSAPRPEVDAVGALFDGCTPSLYAFQDPPMMDWSIYPDDQDAVNDLIPRLKALLPNAQAFPKTSISRTILSIEDKAARVRVDLYLPSIFSITETAQAIATWERPIPRLAPPAPAELPTIEPEIL